MRSPGQDEEQTRDAEKYLFKQLVFVLICIQISFPKIYEILLLLEPDFISWDDEFFKKATGGVDETKELREALRGFNRERT